MRHVRSAEIFKSYVSGAFGKALVGDFFRGLVTFPRLSLADSAHDFFNMSLQAMGDHWRRFQFPVSGMPFTLIALVDLEPEGFLAKYADLQRQQDECFSCADIEFSAILLGYIPRGSSIHEPGVELQIRKLKAFLADLCIFAPLSTDIVECFHGYTQHQLSRWRGAKVTDPVAQERVCWSSLTQTYAQYKKWVWDKYLDKQFLRRLSAFGKKGFGPNTRRLEGEQRPAPTKAKLTLKMLDHMVSFDKQLPAGRKVCGASIN